MIIGRRGGREEGLGSKRGRREEGLGEDEEGRMGIGKRKGGKEEEE
jgi:hypothetical protein